MKSHPGSTKPMPAILALALCQPCVAEPLGCTHRPVPPTVLPRMRWRVASFMPDAFEDYARVLPSDESEVWSLPRFNSQTWSEVWSLPRFNSQTWLPRLLRWTSLARISEVAWGTSEVAGGVFFLWRHSTPAS